MFGCLANHGNERMNQGMGTQVGMLKFSRSNESEAVDIGLILTCKGVAMHRFTALKYY